VPAQAHRSPGRLARTAPALVLTATLAVGCASHAAPATGATGSAWIVDNRPGDDWRLPAHVTPTPGTGFYHETTSARDGVAARSFDLTWRQIEPRPGVFDVEAKGLAQEMSLKSFRAQMADPRPFWLRLFASATTWAPAWLTRECRYRTVGPDYDGQQHIPIWDPCVWARLKQIWRTLLIDQGLRSDPRLVMVYVPGAFTWAEFDYDMIDIGARQGLTFDAYKAWHDQMVTDLVTIMNGENDDPADDQAHKLVYTGEDYPYSAKFGDRVALFARDAVTAGMGIRNGITEEFNHHLGEAPAYGSHIGDDGHLHTDDSWVGFTDGRIIGAENECYTECGFHSRDPRWAFKLSNLKALQLRVNWLYISPGASYGGSLMRSHLRWVRQELGRHAADAPDAWVALRDAEDRYWADRGDRRWRGFPYVRNLERWVAQRDVRPDGLARKGTSVHVGDPAPDNGRSYETLRTNVRRGVNHIYLDVDEAFLDGAAHDPIELKVTYRDFPGRDWRVLYRAADGTTSVTPVVRGTDAREGAFRTVTFRIDAPRLDSALPGGTDIALEAVHGDLEASFVRVIKAQSPVVPVAAADP
jgi:hypothetical protein